MFLKLIFSSEDGRILGAQATGGEGVEKRIDVIAMAIQMGASVYDLEEVELCYAPQFGSAKDAVNLAGMAAANILRGDAPTVHWQDADLTGAVILDARSAEDYAEGHIEGAKNITMETVRQSIDDIEREKEVLVYCYQGKRSYNICRVLLQKGFKCRNISGGFRMYQAWQKLGQPQDW